MKHGSLLLLPVKAQHLQVRPSKGRLTIRYEDGSEKNYSLDDVSDIERLAEAEAFFGSSSGYSRGQVQTTSTAGAQQIVSAVQQDTISATPLQPQQQPQDPFIQAPTGQATSGSYLQQPPTPQFLQQPDMSAGLQQPVDVSAQQQPASVPQVSGQLQQDPTNTTHATSASNCVRPTTCASCSSPSASSATTGK